MPEVVASSVCAVPLSMADAVLPWAVNVRANLSSNVEMALVLSTSPHAASPLLTIRAVGFGRSLRETGKALAPLEGNPTRGAALTHTVNQPTSVEAAQAMSLALSPRAARVTGDHFWCEGDPVALLSEVATHFTDVLPRSAYVLCQLPRFGIAAPPPGAAYSVTGRLYASMCNHWDAAEDDAVNDAWVKRVSAVLTRSSVGHYIGLADLTQPSRVARSLSRETWRRLADVRDEYDPDHRLFGLIDEPDL
jgi:FAD/FMN-containing dehydrogenase